MRTIKTSGARIEIMGDDGSWEPVCGFASEEVSLPADRIRATGELKMDAEARRSFMVWSIMESARAVARRIIG